MIRMTELDGFWDVYHGGLHTNLIIMQERHYIHRMPDGSWAHWGQCDIVSNEAGVEFLILKLRGAMPVNIHTPSGWVRQVWPVEECWELCGRRIENFVHLATGPCDRMEWRGGYDASASHRGTISARPQPLPSAPHQASIAPYAYGAPVVSSASLGQSAPPPTARSPQPAHNPQGPTPVKTNSTGRFDYNSAMSVAIHAGAKQMLTVIASGAPAYSLIKPGTSYYTLVHPPRTR